MASIKWENLITPEGEYEEDYTLGVPGKKQEGVLR